jgi:hypothetical protein
MRARDSHVTSKNYGVTQINDIVAFEMAWKFTCQRKIAETEENDN